MLFFTFNDLAAIFAAGFILGFFLQTKKPRIAAGLERYIR